MGFYNCSVTMEDGGLNPIKEAARYIGENYFCYHAHQVDHSSDDDITNEQEIPLKIYFNTRYSYTAAEDGKPCYGIIFEPFVVDLEDEDGTSEIIPLEKIVWDDINVIHDIDSIKRRVAEKLTGNRILLAMAGIEDFESQNKKVIEIVAHLVSLGNNPHILSSEFDISYLFDAEEDNYINDRIKLDFVLREENQN